MYVYLIWIKHILYIWCESVAKHFFNHQEAEEKSLVATMMDILWVTIAIFVIMFICLFVIFESCTSRDDGDDDIYPHIRWDKLRLWFVSQLIVSTLMVFFVVFIYHDTFRMNSLILEDNENLGDRRENVQSKSSTEVHNQRRGERIELTKTFHHDPFVDSFGC